MLATIDPTQIAAGAISTMGILGVVISAWYGVTKLRNGKAPKDAAPPPMPPTFPCPAHDARLEAHDHELVDLKKSDERQWKEITDQGKLQAATKATLDGVATDLGRLVEKLL